jgi:DNA-binding transcriptional MerR regulator
MSTVMEQEHLLTKAETAALCRVNVRTLERWARAGVGPRQIQVGLRQKRYNRADVEAYLRTGEQQRESA